MKRGSRAIGATARQQACSERLRSRCEVAPQTPPSHLRPARYSRYATKCAALYQARYGSPLEPELPTFNAGVLLIDLQRWRRQNLTADSAWWMAQHAAAADGLWALGSQPPLHLALHKRWAALPASWNLDGLGRVGNLSPAQLRAAKLLHWTGKKKPWLPDGMYVAQWRRHVRRLCVAGGGGAWKRVAWPCKGVPRELCS